MTNQTVYGIRRTTWQKCNRKKCVCVAHSAFATHTYPEDWLKIPVFFGIYHLTLKIKIRIGKRLTTDSHHSGGWWGRKAGTNHSCLNRTWSTRTSCVKIRTLTSKEKGRNDNCWVKSIGAGEEVVNDTMQFRKTIRHDVTTRSMTSQSSNAVKRISQALNAGFEEVRKFSDFLNLADVAKVTSDPCRTTERAYVKLCQHLDCVINVDYLQNKRKNFVWLNAQHGHRCRNFRSYTIRGFYVIRGKSLTLRSCKRRWCWKNEAKIRSAILRFQRYNGERQFFKKRANSYQGSKWAVFTSRHRKEYVAKKTRYKSALTYRWRHSHTWVQIKSKKNNNKNVDIWSSGENDRRENDTSPW